MSADAPIVIEDDPIVITDDGETSVAKKTTVADGLLDNLKSFRLRREDNLTEQVGGIKDVFTKMNFDVKVKQQSASSYTMCWKVPSQVQKLIEQLFPYGIWSAFDTEYMTKTDGKGEMVVSRDKNNDRWPVASTSGAILMVGIDAVKISFGARTEGSDLVEMCLWVHRHVLIPANPQMSPEELKSYLLTQKTVPELCKGDKTKLRAVYDMFPNAVKQPKRTFHEVDKNLPEIQALKQFLDYSRDKGIPTAGFTITPDAEGNRIGAHMQTLPPPGIDLMKLAKLIWSFDSRVISLDDVGEKLHMRKLLFGYPFDDVQRCPTAEILRASEQICDLSGGMWREMKEYCLRDVQIVTLLIAVAIRSYGSQLQECMPGGSRKRDERAGAAAAPQGGAAKRRKT